MEDSDTINRNEKHRRKNRLWEIKLIWFQMCEFEVSAGLLCKYLQQAFILARLGQERRSGLRMQTQESLLKGNSCAYGNDYVCFRREPWAGPWGMHIFRGEQMKES